MWLHEMQGCFAFCFSCRCVFLSEQLPWMKFVNSEPGTAVSMQEHLGKWLGHSNWSSALKKPGMKGVLYFTLFVHVVKPAPKGVLKQNKQFGIWESTGLNGLASMHNFGLSDAEANQLNSYAAMPFNSTLAMKDLSFRSMPSLELHQQKLFTYVGRASFKKWTDHEDKMKNLEFQWISMRHDNASIATCLDFRLHTMAMTDGKVSKEEKKQMDQAGFLNTVSISLGRGCLIHIMVLFTFIVVLCRQTYVCDCLWIYPLILIDIDSYSLIWSNHYQVSDPFDICHGMNWDSSVLASTWHLHRSSIWWMTCSSTQMQGSSESGLFGSHCWVCSGC